LLAAAATLGWAAWPSGDPRLAIVFDDAATRAAKEFLAAPVVPSTHRPPNVVVILADDLGKYDVDVYGRSPTPTPNISRLAAQGITFTAGYVTAPVCSPSRAALMTGRYPQRFGFELLTHERYPRNRLEWWASRVFFTGHGWHAVDRLMAPTHADVLRQGLPPDEITLAELLRKHGYRTGIFGKWHLGIGEQSLPTTRGFDYHYGFYEAFSLYDDPDDPDIVNSRGNYFADRYQWWQGRSGNSAIRRNGAIVEEHEYLTKQIAREAIAWMDAQKDAPFFAYIPFNAPHAPLQAPSEYVKRFDGVSNPDQRVYYGMIAALDDAVGEVLAAIDRSGRAGETIVFFASDNGAASYTGIVDNSPLRQGKLTNFEGGINVPFLARWPQRLTAGATYREPVSTLDVFATIARAAGATLPTDRQYDGVDLLPYLTGERVQPPHEALFWRAEGHRAVRAGRYKLIADARTGARVLFDLDADPSESHDLAAEQPAVAADLEARLRAWESGLIPPRWPQVLEYRFAEGGKEFVFPL
jgi:arylsulfatase A-like enzyme